MNQLPVLYKYASTGALQQWCIEIEDNKYRTHSGQVGGKVTTTAWTVCDGKNTGKSNSTTPQQQAELDATSKWQKKVDREQFASTVEELKTIKFVQPMLAQRFEDRKHQLDFNTGVWIQCKLNGARCVATKHGVFSRKGSVWKSVPHIADALVAFFDVHPDVILDGELFNEDLRQDLGSIISLIAKKKFTDQDIEKSKQLVKFYVYDVVDTSLNYSDRYHLTQQYVTHINNPCVTYLHATVAHSIREIDDALVLFESQGHEGAIVRTNGKYECKRSKHLLKHKTFVDDEFEIVGVIEGEGNLTNKVGAFVLKDSRGVEFNSAPTGSHDYWAKMWQDKHTLVGKTATVKYKDLTVVNERGGGVPSFGKVVAIRDYEN